MKELSLSAINRVANQFDTIIKVLEESKTDTANLRPSPGKWSVQENMAHIGRYQEVFLERLEAILNQEVPSFERYIAEEDHGFSTWTSWPVDQLIANFRSVRKKLFNRLIDLKPDEVERKGRHPVYGERNLVWWTEFFLLHENHHLFTIFRLISEKQTKAEHSQQEV